MSEPRNSDTKSLVDLATPFLELIGRLGRSDHVVGLDKLHAKIVEHLSQFDHEAVNSGARTDLARDAHYLLCATIDDVVLASPWGANSFWSRQGMVRMFHRDSTSGDRFYEVVSRLEGDPNRNHECLSLAYFCLAAGFQGRLRIHPQGAALMRRVRDDLYKHLRVEPLGQLSEHWRGSAVPDHAPAMPLAAIASIVCGTLAVLVAIFTVLSVVIGRQGDALVEAFAAAAPHLPATLHVPARTVTQRIAHFLAPEIDAGLLKVDDVDSGTRIRIANNRVFGSGSADVDPSFAPLIERIAQSLARENKPVLVVGHTDDQPISNARFPSNVELSLARAKAVADQLARRLDPNSIKSEGRAADQPIESNDSEKGREANRRTEILVLWRAVGDKP